MTGELVAHHIIVEVIRDSQAGRILPAIDIPETLAKQTGLLRSMSRAGVLLSTCALQVEDRLRSNLARDPYRRAVYCAIDQASADHAAISRLPKEPEAMRQLFRRTINPKWGLHVSNGLAASALAILLEIEGGVHTFHHSRWACLHALEQARADLVSGLIESALLVGVQGADDPLIAARREGAPRRRCLVEGAGLLLLSRKSIDSVKLSEWVDRDDETETFGIAEPLLRFLRAQ